jgi:hypothetical protein
MTRSILLFISTFLVGAIIALVARAALFQPHAQHEAAPVGGGDYAPMVTNKLAPATPAPKPAPAVEDHSAHGATTSSNAGTTSVASADDKPVNTVCAMCGMDVDPNLPTATYQGKTIGFGCRMCPPRFHKDPDRWGPLYLRNEVVKR